MGTLGYRDFHTTEQVNVSMSMGLLVWRIFASLRRTARLSWGTYVRLVDPVDSAPLSLASKNDAWELEGPPGGFGKK